ncbi:MAG: hypothetical protein QXG39_03775 [Candidatus Aenigmatarchaeota archaeon]
MKKKALNRPMLIVVLMILLLIALALFYWVGKKIIENLFLKGV